MSLGRTKASQVSSVALYVIVLMVATPVSSQITAFNAEVIDNLQSQVTSGDYMNVLATASNVCGASYDDARDRNKTVDERASAATESRQCVEAMHGIALGLANYESRPAIDGVLDPFIEELILKEQEAKSEQDFLGLAWGVGVGYSFSFDDAIDGAAIVDDVVRVSSSKEEEPRIFLESHKYFWCNKNGKDGTRGCGPFVAVAAKENDVLGGVAIGFMYGRKAKKADSEGFSIGIGAVLDSGVKDLADGFMVNQAPPGTETAVRFETKSRWSAVLFVTRTF